MSIKYEPSKMIARLASKNKLKRLVNSRLSLKRAALSFLDEADFISKKKVIDVALKTIKGYEARLEENPDLKKQIAANPKQLIQRVQNEVAFQIKNEIKEKYDGTRYRWLPSDADEPDPEHQLKYGEIYVIGEGEMPGDRYGCRCGMEILTNETQLDL